MGPIDYTRQVADPFASAMRGFQMGASIQQMQAQQQEQQLAIQQAQAQAERQRVVQSEIGALMANKAPTAQDYIRVASLLPEKEAESMRKNWDTLSADRQRGELGFASQVLSAANVGKPEIAIGLIRDRAAAEKNAGAEDKAKAYETWASILEADPAQGAKTISLLVAQLPGGDKVLSGLSTIGKEFREQAGEGRAVAKEGRKAALFPSELTEAQSKAEKARVEAKYAEQLQQAGITEKQWAVRNLQSQIGDRSARIGLDRERLRLETAEKLASIQEKMTAIPAGLQPEINKAAVAAGAAKQAVGALDDLAKRFSDASLAGGVAATAAESLKKFTGNQDAATQLRQEYTRIRNSQALKFLPPGPATDKDVAMALEGFPPATADSKEMASFLRGMAKLSAVEASVESAKVDWMASNKGLLTRAGNTFIAGDYAVKPGETFQEVSTRIATDVAQRRAPKPAGPTPKPIDRSGVMDAADAILAGKK